VTAPAPQPILRQVESWLGNVSDARGPIRGRASHRHVESMHAMLRAGPSTTGWWSALAEAQAIAAALAAGASTELHVPTHDGRTCDLVATRGPTRLWVHVKSLAPDPTLDPAPVERRRAVQEELVAALRGVEGVTVAGCTFAYAGGSAVVVAGHALGVQIVDSGVFGAGAHGVLILGSSEGSNATGAALPRGVRVAGNVLRGTGKENKFAAAVAVAIAPRAVVEGNVLYEMPRTGIYYNDVAASPGQLMRNNVLFGANRETTDTGPVYVYNRLAFLGDNAAGPSVEMWQPVPSSKPADLTAFAAWPRHWRASSIRSTLQPPQ
jgi:hypothetical protein